MTGADRAFTVLEGLDLGLFSDDPATVEFYAATLDLPFIETIRHSETYEERFYQANGVALKVNYSTEPMAPGHSGYCGIVLPREGQREPQELTDPDGTVVTLVPPGTGGIRDVAVQVRVGDLDAQRRFLVDGLGLAETTDGFVIGGSLIQLVPSGTPTSAQPTWRRGFNYVVVFVDDIVAAHEHVLRHGATHSVPPVRLWDRVVFSWVRDPNGNWVELVQQAHPERPLPDVTPIEQRWSEIIRWREDGTAF